MHFLVPNDYLFVNVLRARKALKFGATLFGRRLVLQQRDCDPLIT